MSRRSKTCHGSDCPDHAHLVVGHAINSLALLETRLDDLAVAVNDRHPKLAMRLSKKFPYQLSEKVAFIVDALVAMPVLRTFGDGAGWLNINSIGCMLDEVCELRNNLVHGHLFMAEYDVGGFVIEVHRVPNVKSGDGQRRLTKVTHRTGSEYILHHIAMARSLAAFVGNCIDAVDGVNVRQKMDATLRGQANCREIHALMQQAGDPQAEEHQRDIVALGIL